MTKINKIVYIIIIILALASINKIVYATSGLDVIQGKQNEEQQTEDKHDITDVQIKPDLGGGMTQGTGNGSSTEDRHDITDVPTTRPETGTVDTTPNTPNGTGSGSSSSNGSTSGNGSSSSSGGTSKGDKEVDKHTAGEIIDEAGKFIEIGNQTGKDKIKEEDLKKLSDTIYNILLVVGIIIAVLVGLIMGIKFIMGSIEEKAEIKTMLIPYIIGCVVVFGAFTIWKIVVDILQTM